MLKGIPQILSPEMLKVLCEMGHGDRIVIADGKITHQGPKDEILPEIMGTASAVDACAAFYDQQQGA